uniref:Uncharacterized protein n=1 Tax=Fagus sylvatica TaxID=28930 RepID=A0A2N9IWS1_FAGSY
MAASPFFFSFFLTDEDHGVSHFEYFDEDHGAIGAEAQLGWVGSGDIGKGVGRRQNYRDSQISEKEGRKKVGWQKTVELRIMASTPFCGVLEVAYAVIFIGEKEGKKKR